MACCTALARAKPWLKQVVGYSAAAPLPPLQEALSWAQKASDITAHSADSLALRASLYLERRDYPNAKQVGAHLAVVWRPWLLCMML